MPPKVGLLGLAIHSTSWNHDKIWVALCLDGKSTLSYIIVIVQVYKRSGQHHLAGIPRFRPAIT